MPDQALVHSLVELLDAKTRAEATHVTVSKSIDEAIDVMAKIVKAQADKEFSAAGVSATGPG